MMLRRKDSGLMMLLLLTTTDQLLRASSAYYVHSIAASSVLALWYYHQQPCYQIHPVSTSPVPAAHRARSRRPFVDGMMFLAKLHLPLAFCVQLPAFDCCYARHLVILAPALFFLFSLFAPFFLIFGVFFHMRVNSAIQALFVVSKLSMRYSG